MRRALQMTWLALALTVGVSAASATASGDVSPLLPIEAVFRASFAPAKLPAHEEAPVSLLLTETIGDPDGTHPPPLEAVEVELDRHLAVDVEGLPVCHPGLQARQTTVAEQCDPAKVGVGSIDVEVAFPEQQPTEVKGRLQVYNGGHARGQDTFWLYTYLPAPVTGGIAMPLKLRPEQAGHHGLRGRLEVPKIANGAGSIAYLGARFRKGIFSASCPTRQLLTHASSKFADGEVVASTLVRTCRPAASG